MQKVNCQYIDRVCFCKHKDVKRSLFGLGAKVCIEYNSNKICKFKTHWPKPKATPPSPPPKKYKVLINVKKYHLCHRCYDIIIRSMWDRKLFLDNNREE